MVIPMPTPAAVRMPGTSSVGTWAVTPVASFTARAMAVAATAPSRAPRAAPMMPSSRAPLNTNRLSWARVAPAARSSPTSRARSPTVIDSVLTIRKAPTNRTIAATRAAVPWNDADEARRFRARSPGEARTYGSTMLAWSWAVTESAAPGAMLRSIRVAPARPNADLATSIGTTIVRPEPASGPRPGMMPMIRRSTSPSLPNRVPLPPSV